MVTTINGVPAPTTRQGITQSFGNGDRIAGDSGNNFLQGNGGNDVFYGGGGHDTFIITASSMLNSHGSTDGINGASAVILDWSDNDFLALEGFGPGSTLTFSRFGGNQDGSFPTEANYEYYTLHDTTTGNNYTIFIHSVDHTLLEGPSPGAFGDMNFFA